MTIISFFIPTDKDILRDIKENAHSIKFIGKGSVTQRLHETRFVRTFIHRFDAEKTTKQVIYLKKGLSWELLTITLIDKKNSFIS